jgi:hypothetical protein
MVLTPLIVSVCLQLGSQYDAACNTALEQAAVQSGIAGKAQYLAKDLEHRTIRYLNPSEEAEIIFATFGFTAKALIDRRATLAIPNPFLKRSSVSLGIGPENLQLSFRMDF